MSDIESILEDIADDGVISTPEISSQEMQQELGKLGENIGQNLRFSIEDNDTFITDGGDIKVSLDDIKSNILTGNFTQIFEDLGIDMNNLSQDIRDQIDELSEKAKTNTFNTTEENFSDVKENVNQLVDNGKIEDADPQSKEQLEEQLEKNGKSTSDLKSKLETAGKAGKLGMFLIVGTLTIIGAVDLFDAVNNHKKQMNGCWLINNSTGDKCKILEFSCSDENELPSGYSPCSICTAQDFNTTNYTCTTQGSQGQYSVFDCTPLSIKNISKPADTNSPLCGTNKGQCTCAVTDKPPVCCNDNTNMCNSKDIYVPAGYFLRCVNVTWWEAFGDLAGNEFNKISNDIFGPLGNIVESILKYTVISIAAIFGLIIIYYIFKFFWNRRNKNT